MAMTGFICQDEYLAKCAKLSDQEVGRLFRALMSYHATGIEPELAGRESIAFDFIKEDIDKTEKAYAAKCEKNRQNRLTTNVDERERTITNVDERAQNINIKEKENKKEIDNNNGNSAGAWLSDSDVQEALERDRKIEDASRAWGLPCNEGNMIKARDMAREYTLKWLLRAIETAGSGKEQTWRYVAGILKSWKENGGPDTPKKQRAAPVKTVSAQQYGQRHYTEEELLAVSDDLLAEAKKARETA